MIEDSERGGYKEKSGSVCALCNRWVAAVGFEVMQVVIEMTANGLASAD